MSDHPNGGAVRVQCVMSGDAEALTIKPIGRFGVSFVYNDDCSVIVNGDDLRRIYEIVSRQCAAWDSAHPHDRPTIKAAHSRGRGAS